MIKRNYYDLLGVDCCAGIQEIKRAYRHLAHQFHPDKNPGNPAAEEHFKKITQAYEVLQDPKKRAHYDRCGGSGAEKKADFWDAESFSPGEDSVFQEILEDFFGAGRSRPRKAKGKDLRYNLEISLEEAAFGAQKEIQVPRLSICPVCRGSRCCPGTAPLVCSNCEGSGSRQTQRGFFIVETPCPHCQGEGEVIRRPCVQCEGKGRLKITRRLRFEVPPGVDRGTRLRLRGEGEMGRNGGPFGDLYIVIAVKKHPIFTRVGPHLYCEVLLTGQQAARGGEIEIPTLEGKARMKILRGMETGGKFVLKGQGIRTGEGERRGDLHVKVHIEPGLNSEEIDLAGHPPPKKSRGKGRSPHPP